MKQLPIIPQLVDAQQRSIQYLRVSVTDRCNYSCTYCVPQSGEISMVKRAELLSFEEILRLVKLMVRMGLKRVRLTGGEPTLRKDLHELVTALSAIPEIEEVAMTSNAHLLETMAPILAKAGLASVNISLDTVDPGPFAELTVRGDLARVIRGIDASLAAGLRVSLNAVALRGVNDRQLVPLCEFAWNRGITPRFIEHMPMSGGAAFDSASQLTAADIRDSITQITGEALLEDGNVSGRGPARYWRLAESGRRFGIISAMSEHFCASCNRLRLSASGNLHTCLADDATVDLQKLMRDGASNSLLMTTVFDALQGKKAGHEFERSGVGGPVKHMLSIGG